MLFSAIDDKQTVIRNSKTGVYRQAKLYERNSELYAGVGGGFIRLMEQGRTSSPNMLWDDIEVKYEVTTGIHRALKYVEKRAAH
ncbi:hypothetical protein UP09_03355 [Bradyrhizobium sp. LTSP885]|uniref:hypothetical protein n=1 Tax=Bradyrhizobium sp. LTSP885 TaxID=1619232 RepID=UPI0005C8C985|nr:hypothetical protein [Bradyrhizobium sp. LTSP885]KJC51091.1 hypothetical protein UP09_03355 [Bradyrhizobium sp. LTSP885]